VCAARASGQSALAYDDVAGGEIAPRGADLSLHRLPRVARFGARVLAFHGVARNGSPRERSAGGEVPESLPAYDHGRRQHRTRHFSRPGSARRTRRLIERACALSVFDSDLWGGRPRHRRILRACRSARGSVPATGTRSGAWSSIGVVSPARRRTSYPTCWAVRHPGRSARERVARWTGLGGRCSVCSQRRSSPR
jgi:hypothetical protein